MSERLSPILEPSGRPFVHANGKPRPELLEAMLVASSGPVARHQASLTYDATRDSTEYQAHWANTDALDADSANSSGIRTKARNRSRYEAGSNGYYAGILETHVNMLVGVGPQLRMLTKRKTFNQEIETSFWAWAEKVELTRKLRAMAHAKLQDGEAFAILQQNPAIDDEIQLDLLPIEAEQVQTPYLPQIRREEGHYIDGIRFDALGNIRWYDVLPEHPGGMHWTGRILDPVRVPPAAMLHWFKAIRPGQHRGMPALLSTLNVGASARRMREATLAAAETAADLNVMLTTQLTPDTVSDPMRAMSSMPIQKRMVVAAPMGWDAHHFKSEHPSSTYDSFNRALISEQARPISMPYNAASCDSSTYSFASGKLDTLCYRAGLNVDRQECNGSVLDRIFAAWFAEFSLIRRRRFAPLHQWDWPQHPVIDAESDARATDTQLKNGTTTFREAYSSQGRDYEDALAVMSEDWFGDASAENVALARKINMLRNVPKDALPFVASAVGIVVPQAQEPAA